MKTLADKIRKRHKTPFQQLAEKHQVDVQYVYMIGSGYRIPKRGKGAKILKDLQEMATQN